MKKRKLAMLAIAAVSMFSFMACSSSDDEDLAKFDTASNGNKPGASGGSTPP